jgi:probable rRNA maturation factor
MPPVERPPRVLSVHNHQRAVRVDVRHLRRLAGVVLDDLLALPGYDLEVSLLADPAMTRLNEQFVHHAGSTDVITFDYTEAPAALRPPAAGLRGELFLCPDEALRQARRYHTTWQAELARYFVHGVLHLLGHDDLAPAPRRRMKRAENLCLRRLAARLPLERLARATKPSP